MRSTVQSSRVVKHRPEQTQCDYGGETDMTQFTVRPMLDQDWPEVAWVYQEGMDTNLATFQTTCPAWEDWNKAHHKACRLVHYEGGPRCRLGGAEPRLQPPRVCGRR